jgi:hypothetical protein
VTTSPDPNRGRNVSPVVAVAGGAIVFVALSIAGLGVTSLLLDVDVIEAPGLGQLPGAVGFAAALVAWVAVLAPALRARPGVGIGVLAGIAAGAAYTAGIFVGALGVGTDVALAASVAWRLVTTGFAAVVAIAGILAATGAAVAVRTSGRSEWPWERREREERDPGE